MSSVSFFFKKNSRKPSLFKCIYKTAFLLHKKICKRLPSFMTNIKIVTITLWYLVHTRFQHICINSITNSLAHSYRKRYFHDLYKIFTIKYFISSVLYRFFKEKEGIYLESELNILSNYHNDWFNSVGKSNTFLTKEYAIRISQILGKDKFTHPTVNGDVYVLL